MKLPLPDAAAAEHSKRLCKHIADEIRSAGGWIPFSRYMNLALFAPGLGYYSGGSHKFGATGDFVTAPELSSVFAQTLAVQVEQVMRLSAPNIVEAGPGSGTLAAELLLELERRDALPVRYGLLELSAELRERQAATLAARAPHLMERVLWLERLPERHAGVVMANEVLDAMPVDLLAWHAGGVCERGVTLDQEGSFRWEDRPASDLLAEAAMALGVTPPYLSEVGRAAQAWVASWGSSLEQGALLLIDYGFPAREYYHAQRSSGTLMCHYRHHAHDDPFFLPGLNDITAHVDFSAIAEAGVDAGLACYGYTSQAQFLLNCGITDVLARVSLDDQARYLPLAASAQKLLNPSEMGELFKILALGRGIDTPLIGFTSGDRSHTL